MDLVWRRFVSRPEGNTAVWCQTVAAGSSIAETAPSDRHAAAGTSRTFAARRAVHPSAVRGPAISIVDVSATGADALSIVPIARAGRPVVAEGPPTSVAIEPRDRLCRLAVERRRTILRAGPRRGCASAPRGPKAIPVRFSPLLASPQGLSAGSLSIDSESGGMRARRGLRATPRKTVGRTRLRPVPRRAL